MCSSVFQSLKIIKILYFQIQLKKKWDFGTGVIVTNNGYILSNVHVTGSKYSTCYITLQDGRNFIGTVIWSDEDMDLSITKIQADGLEYATLGDSSNLRPGETVYAIGNPIGYEFRRTVTSGIISAVNRTISFDENNTKVYMSGLIQTDATINPGNSGGPLITPSGLVIGINTVKITSAEGIGFAVPVNVVKGVINKISTEGEYESGNIGIFAYDKDAIKYLSTNLNLGNGIYVAKIIPGGAASKTDLKEGDIINEIDGKGVNTMNQFKEYIYIKKKGDNVKLNITRGKLKLEINVILQ